jgi:hypothetical protein
MTEEEELEMKSNLELEFINRNNIPEDGKSKNEE